LLPTPANLPSILIDMEEGDGTSRNDHNGGLSRIEPETPYCSSI
jgi:hypothetical protein